jgi:N-acetylneuraminate synthase
MYGSDQSASIEPNGLKNLIDQVRKVEKAMGDGIKIFSDDEKVNAEKLRQHIY